MTSPSISTTGASKTQIATKAIDGFYGAVGDKVAEKAKTAGRKVQEAGRYVKGQYNTKLDAALETIQENGELVAFEDPLSHEKLAGEITKTSSSLAKLDSRISQIGDKVSKKVGRAGYSVIKTGLTLLGLGKFRLGRVLREALGTTVGVSLRLAIKVAEYALRILPWIAAAIIYMLPGVGLFLAMKIKKLENELAASRSAVPAPSTLPSYADVVYADFMAGRLAVVPAPSAPPADAEVTAGRTPPTYAEVTASDSPVEVAEETQVVSRMPSMKVMSLTAAGVAGIAAIGLGLPVLGLGAALLAVATL